MAVRLDTGLDASPGSEDSSAPSHCVSRVCTHPDDTTSSGTARAWQGHRQEFEVGSLLSL